MTKEPVEIMTAAFQAFMSELIDYAGLFPPAQLDLDPALRNYLRYRTEPDRWMLGRFIISAAQLAELASYRDDLRAADDKPVRFAVLVGGGAADSEATALAKLRAEAALIRDFQAHHGPAVKVEVLETRLPDEVATSSEAERTRVFLQAWQPILAAADLAHLTLYVEIAAALDQPQRVSGAIADLAGIGDFTDSGQTPAHAAAQPPITRWGLKLRCGGVEPKAIPAPDQIALVIDECRQQGVPLKCTAGLHHPVRHLATDIGAMSHGFFNVFGAGLLANARSLSREAIVRCLLDEDASQFRFTDAGFSWGRETLTAAEVAAVRREAMISFGSCSFDEPREDLRAFGLLA